MPTHIKGIQNISSALFDAVYIPDCKRNLKRPYFKAKENFEIAFSKEKYRDIEYSFNKNLEDFNNAKNEWDIQDPIPRYLNRRITYFLMGCIYSLPLINTIIYIALNRFQPRQEYRVLAYEEVVERANEKFKENPNRTEIIERIKKRLEDCHYKKDVKEGKRPQIDIIESDGFEMDLPRDKGKKLNYEAIKFIQALPKMHIASVPPSYWQK